MGNRKIQPKQIDLKNLTDSLKLDETYASKTTTESSIETINENLDTKAPINNPTFTGTVNVPAVGEETNTQAATVGYVESEIGKLVGVENLEELNKNLDTIKELQDAVTENQGIIEVLQSAADANTTYDLIGGSSKTNGEAGISLVGSDKTEDIIKITGTGTVSVTSDASGNLLVDGANTNVTSDLSIETEAANGDVALKFSEGDTTKTFSFTGSGAINVTSDANGNIDISDAIQTFSTVQVAEVTEEGTTEVKETIEAEANTDALTLAAGNNVELVPDPDSKAIIIEAADTTYEVATTETNGLMSSTDKVKIGNTVTVEGGASLVVPEGTTSGFTIEFTEEDIENLDTVTTITADSTDSQLPTAKAVYTLAGNKADEDHTHTSSDITDTIPVTKGGTGCTSIADTTYTTARYRASSLHSTETTPTTNGVIAWMYE